MKAPALHLRFDSPTLPPELSAFRSQIRDLLAQTRAEGLWEPDAGSWGAYNQDLSRRLGQMGWIGLTWPKEYGGAARTYLERYVLTEELLAAGAPAGAHWVADRQSGPLILRFGTEQQKRRFLPPITRGESYFCIGMSEPDSGSDLASIRSRAVKVEGGWLLNGTKIWTSWAHNAHYIIVLCRTQDPAENRHAGMSQFVVDLSSPGIEMSGITNIAGHRSFNEIVFRDVFLRDDQLIGTDGNGWSQVSAELAYERSGPERFLTNYRILCRLVDTLGRDASASATRTVGTLAARLWTLREMALSIAAMLQRGEDPAVEAAFVKDLGTHLQQELPEIARALLHSEGLVDDEFLTLLDDAIHSAPAYTIQGGTTEILRGIIARGLRLR